MYMAILEFVLLCACKRVCHRHHITLYDVYCVCLDATFIGYVFGSSASIQPSINLLLLYAVIKISLCSIGPSEGLLSRSLYLVMRWMFVGSFDVCRVEYSDVIFVHNDHKAWNRIMRQRALYIHRTYRICWNAVFCHVTLKFLGTIYISFMPFV